MSSSYRKQTVVIVSALEDRRVGQQFVVLGRKESRTGNRATEVRKPGYNVFPVGNPDRTVVLPADILTAVASLLPDVAARIEVARVARVAADVAAEAQYKESQAQARMARLQLAITEESAWRDARPFVAECRVANEDVMGGKPRVNINITVRILGPYYDRTYRGVTTSYQREESVTMTKGADYRGDPKHAVAWSSLGDVGIEHAKAHARAITLAVELLETITVEQAARYELVLREEWEAKLQARRLTLEEALAEAEDMVSV